MNRNENSMMDKIGKFINYIGEAGINEVYNVNDTIGTTNPYTISLGASLNAGVSYHYYDYVLDIKCADERNLVIETKAIDEDHGYNNIHDTKVSITYYLPNNMKYKLTGYLKGWNYNTLLNLKTNDLKNILKPEINEEKNQIGNLPRNQRRCLFTVEELDKLLQYLDDDIEIAINKLAEDRKKVEDVLSSLSDDQIIVLKKVLKINKY